MAAAKAALDLSAGRRGWKPRPFNARSKNRSKNKISPGKEDNDLDGK